MTSNNAKGIKNKRIKRILDIERGKPGKTTRVISIRQRTLKKDYKKLQNKDSRDGGKNLAI